MTSIEIQGVEIPKQPVIIYTDINDWNVRHKVYTLPVSGRTLGFGASRTLENGISGVGCNQFFSSYTAYGDDSTMWNVYANRVFGLLFFSDLCSTVPWMSTRSPFTTDLKKERDKSALTSLSSK